MFKQKKKINPVFTVLLIRNTQIRVSLKQRRKRNPVVGEGARKQSFGQRGDVAWFGNERLVRQRGVEGADMQEQCNTMNKKSRLSML